MKRREFITLLGGAAAWPLAASAQQPALPVVGFLRSTPASGFAYIVDPFRQGLNDAGFVEGKNVAIEYRWADNQQDRLPGLATDLVRRQVAAIVGAGVPAAQAGKAATATMPIVFVIGADPVRVGLVASINRPGGNITGVVFSVVALGAKLLGMLHELVPKASIIAVLRDPNGPDVESQSRDMKEAARAIGRQIMIVNAANEREFHAAFAKVVQTGAGGLLINSSVFFISQRRQLVTLSARHAIPTVYNQREYAHERQSGRRPFGGQDQNERIVRLFRPLIERLVIFHDLPWPDSVLADEQDKGARLRDFVGQLLLPEAAGAHGLRRKENVRIRFVAL